MNLKQQKRTLDAIKRIIDIVQDPKFSNIVPEVVNGITKFLGTGTPIGKLFLELHKPHFQVLDAAIKATEKTWPHKLAVMQMQRLLEETPRGNSKTVGVLGEPPRSLTIRDWLNLSGLAQQRLKKHVVELDKLLDVNFKICEGLVKLNDLLKQLDKAGKRENVFDLAFWQAVKHHHELNVMIFKTSYSNSVNRLLNHRNGWAKWIGKAPRVRPRTTLLFL